MYAKVLHVYSDDNVASMRLEMKDKEDIVVPIIASEYYQPVVFRVELEEGEHELTFSSEVGADTIAIQRIEQITME